MDVDEAVANFQRATRHCDNLITVHRGSGGPARGRRDEEVSINRAVVVLAVATGRRLYAPQPAFTINARALAEA